MKRMLWLVLSVAMVFVNVRPNAAQQIESPRITILSDQIEQGSQQAVEVFWRQISAGGTPLIERTGERPGFMLATFLWRGDTDTRHVFVEGQLGQLTGTRRADNLMARLRATSVWYRSYWLRDDVRTVYQIGVNAALVPPADRGTGEPGLFDDPFSRIFAPPRNPRAQGRGQDVFRASILDGPNAPAQIWFRARQKTQAGDVQEELWTSTRLKNERAIWVYLPAGYHTTAEPYRLLILTDGGQYVYAQQATVTLDNLIAEKRVPPVVAVFIGNAPNLPGRRPTRSVELTCNEQFVEFLTAEIIPWLRSRYHVTNNPNETIIGGSSYGGLNAAFAALRRPDVFGNVLSQSGAFGWRPSGENEDEWLIKQYAAHSTVNVKFYMDAGLLEVGNIESTSIDWLNMDDQPVPYSPSLLFTNRHMRDVLHAKGYALHYAEVAGGHHPISWRGTFADALIALIGVKNN